MSTSRARVICLVIALALVMPTALAAQGATGTWNATWTTRIGEQRYTFRFEQKGETLTGTATSNLGEARIQDGRVVRNDIAFVETRVIDGIGTRRFEYSGTMAGNKIKFVRNVFDGDRNKITTEEFEATRAN